ncbi:hypothetical protein K504DRAFT_90171 [Pleomassaria siparia CBS 279.74]|uniref:Uncharacterized protein n=1 Tax=Pleomassaria siparia CBS 279.74 TaxID=1314801 RepID=A0A6G1K0D2_9PLEO|nr:hypothetical protein K504DRAFT_90171 [Pleomassaria siparia CBS 279.74]
MASSSKAVNRPVDLAQKEKDVNNKLQLYGIYSAFANGKVPSNKQIDVALNSALQSKPLASPSKQLSTDGQKLVADLKGIIEQAKILLLTKNEGNLLQDFIYQTQQISGGNAQVPGAPVDKDTAKQHGNEALDGLRTLGTLMISNGQFRKLLSDATILLRDIAGDAATNAANKVNPSEHQLAQIDHAADDNTWHENPDISKGNLQAQFKNRIPFGKKDVQNAAGDVNQAAHPDGSRDPMDTANAAQREQQTGAQQGLNGQAALGVAKDRLSENIPDEHKDRAREQRGRAQNYLKGKMPEERREQTIWRLKKMVVEIQGHQDYQRAIETLLRLAEQYAGHGKNLAGQGKESVQGARQDNALQLAEADLKTLLERFANSTSFDDIIDSINQIYRDADKDPQLKQWFKHLDAFVRKCLQQQGFIMEDASNAEWNNIYDEGRELLRGRYRGHTDRIADEFRFIGTQFDQDAQNKAFANSLTNLFNDLGHDAEGNAEFKPHLLKDLQDVIIPGIFENVRYIPIPRIEYSDPMIDAVVENLVIEGDNLAPNVMELGSDNYWRWGRKQIQSKNKNKMMLSVSGVQMDLRDVAYYVKRKQGFPSITDKGVMDVFMGGTGFGFKVEMETADKDDKIHYFKINKVTTDIKNLQIKIKKSNHKLLFGLFKPILLKVMRPVIQRVLEKQIKDSVNQLDAMIFDVKSEADKSVAEAKRNPDPENIQNIYQRYATAANQRIMQGKQKKAELQERTKDTQVNVAVTKHDSIFKNISLPGGISSKATEYKELAAKGDKWESPVFSIGSAKETSSLPKIATVARKPHSTATSNVQPSAGAAGYGQTHTGGAYGQSPPGGAYGQAPPGGAYGQAPPGGAYGQAPTDGAYDQAPIGSAHGQAPAGNGYGQQAGAGNVFAGQVENAFNGHAHNDGPAQPKYNTALGMNNPVLRGDI